MKHTIGTAAKATGKSKSTLSRDIRNGKISAKKLADGSYEIEPVELHRVYPMVSHSNGFSNPKSNDPQPLGNTNETPVLQREVEGLREQVQLLKSERDDLRHRLDQSEEERRRTQHQLTALLTDQREKPESLNSQLPPQPQPEQPPSSVSTKSTWLTVLAIMAASIAVFIFIRVAYGVTG
jgi:peptidoglycan hydrolase CwlO-like protein